MSSYVKKMLSFFSKKQQKEICQYPKKTGHELS